MATLPVLPAGLPRHHHALCATLIVRAGCSSCAKLAAVCCRQHSGAFAQARLPVVAAARRGAQLRGRVVVHHGRCCGSAAVEEAHDDGGHHHGHHHHGHHDEHHDHDHHHDDHHHDHGWESLPNNANPIRRAMHAVFTRLGIVKLAAWLDASRAATIAMVVLFFAAAVSSWAASALTGAAAASALVLKQAATAGVYALGGVPETVSLCFSLADLQVDTHVLMTLAIIGTLFTGAALEGALLLVLFRVAHAVEHTLTHQARGNLTALVAGMPTTALLVAINADTHHPDVHSAREVLAKQVAVGSTVLVRPGTQVPLDGIIVYGSAQVSAKHITGESMPFAVAPGRQVPAGALNHDGLLVVRTTHVAADSTPARIARLTSSAQASRPQLRRWLDRFGEGYSKVVIGGTVLALAVMLFSGVPLLSTATQRGAWYRAMGILTVASPCALVMVPLAYTSAIAAVTQRGVLLKGAAILDALAACRVVAFDKTGTLTSGALSCTLVANPAAPTPYLDTAGSEQLPPVAGHAVAVAVALSQRSNHPVSTAIEALARLPAVQAALPLEIADFQLVPGAGVRGTVVQGGQRSAVRLGSVEFAAQGLSAGQRQRLDASLARHAGSGALSVLSMQPAAPPSSADPETLIFGFEDPLRARSRDGLAVLRDGLVEGTPRGKGWGLVMLTGDNAKSAGHVGELLGIGDVRAGLTPDEKLEAVRSMAATRGGVIMVGDGINDAPALAAATVGMAVVASPTDAAAAAADVLVLNREPISTIPYLLAVAHRTQAVVKQNMWLAAGSIVSLVLPTVFGLLPLWLAVALHEGTTFMVALNSLRLLHIDAHADLMQGAMVSDAPAGRGAAGAGAAPAKAVTGTAAMSVPRAVNGTPAVAKQAAPAVNGDGRHVLTTEDGGLITLEPYVIAG